MSVTVDFAKLGGPVYVGRANGKKARDKLEIDKLDLLESRIKVVVPDITYSINSSYFLGLFGPSVVAFGSQEAFFDHYVFAATDVVMESIRRHADRALAERGILKLE